MAGCGSHDDGRPSLMGDHPAARGIAALRAGRVEEALAHFDALVAAEPAGLPGHFLRAEAIERLGDPERARANLQALAARFPIAEGAARERLALLALRRGDLEGALADLSRALDLGWSNADAIAGDPAFAKAADPRLAALIARARAAAADDGS